MGKYLGRMYLVSLICASFAIARSSPDLLQLWSYQPGISAAGYGSLLCDSRGETTLAMTINQSGRYRISLFHFDRDGNLVWTRYFGDPSERSYMSSAAVDGEGSLYVCGSSYKYRELLLKYSRDGMMLWSRGSRDDRSPWQVYATPNGNAFLIGNTTAHSYVSLYGQDGQRLSFAELTSVGVTYYFYGDLAKNNILYFAGDTGFVCKVNFDGTLLWTRPFPKTGGSPRELHADSHGNVYVSCNQTIAGVDGQLLGKFSADGSLVWSQRFESPSLIDFELDQNDDLFASFGRLVGNTTTHCLTKFDSNHSQIWTTAWEAGGVRSNAIDSSGNPYVIAETLVGNRWADSITGFNSAGDKKWVWLNPNLNPRANRIVVDDRGQLTVELAESTADHQIITVLGFSQPQVALCSSLRCVRGTIFSGELSSIAESEDDYLFLRPGPLLSLNESPIDITFQSQELPASFRKLELTVESAVSWPNLRQSLSVYDFEALTWRPFSDSAASLSDNRLTVKFSSNSGWLLDPSSHTATLRLRITPDLFGMPPWLSRIDQINWVCWR